MRGSDHVTSRQQPTGEDPVILPRATSGTEPQHLLLAVMGDYWFTRQQPLPSAALVDLLDRFDIKQSSARQAVRRLALKGHLVQFRDGRNTSYAFPARSDDVILARLRHVIGFGRHVPEWNSCFTVVAFTIPEDRRDLRHDFRTQLLSLGFGNLYDAVWISPHDKREDAIELINDLEIERGEVFYGPASGSRGPVTMVADAFDTANLRLKYESFIDEYGPISDNEPATSDALALRTLMVNKWLTLRTMDPNLPLEVLPQDWPRSRAYDIFVSLYDRLGAQASAEFGEVIARYDRDLAQSATFYTSKVLDPGYELLPARP